MKKIILTVAAVFAFGFANAQDKKASNEGFSKGDVFVSGNLSLGSTSKVTAYKTSDFTFAPSLNYFVTENISLGLGLTVGSGSTQATSASSKDKTSAFGAGLNGRYYFTPASKFSLFAQLGFDYRSDKTTPAGTASSKVNSFGVAFAPGINYFVSSNFSIEAKVAALSYTSSKGDWTGAENASTFGLGGNWNAVTFGVNYKF